MTVPPVPPVSEEAIAEAQRKVGSGAQASLDTLRSA